LTKSVWSCKDSKIYETNVIATTFVLGTMRRRLVGLYLSPNQIDATTWAGLQLACEEAVDPIWILGDLNADLHSQRFDKLDAMLKKETSKNMAEIKVFWQHGAVKTLGRPKYRGGALAFGLGACGEGWMGELPW
jgi:hypothetical protein